MHVFLRGRVSQGWGGWRRARLKGLSSAQRFVLEERGAGTQTSLVLRLIAFVCSVSVARSVSVALRLLVRARGFFGRSAWLASPLAGAAGPGGAAGPPVPAGPPAPLLLLPLLSFALCAPAPWLLCTAEALGCNAPRTFRRSSMQENHLVATSQVDLHEWQMI